MKIKIIRCCAEGPDFMNITPGSVHEVVRLDQNEIKGLNGFYVKGALDDEVLMFPQECLVLEEGGEE